MHIYSHVKRSGSSLNIIVIYLPNTRKTPCLHYISHLSDPPSEMSSLKFIPFNDNYSSKQQEQKKTNQSFKRVKKINCRQPSGPHKVNSFINLFSSGVGHLTHGVLTGEERGEDTLQVWPTNLEDWVRVKGPLNVPSGRRRAGGKGEDANLSSLCFRPPRWPLHFAENISSPITHSRQ